MRLRVFTPTHVAYDEQVAKVSVQAVGGAFTMLPRHIDTVAVLESGLLSAQADDGETVIAVDGGAVVKVGDDVLVSTPTAVATPGLTAVGRTVQATLLARERHEEDARRALGRLQTDVIERLVEFGEDRW